MPDVDDLCNAAGIGDANRVRAIVRDRPDLARARNAATLSVLAFARYAGHPHVLDVLIDAGPPLTIFEAAMVDRADIVRERAGGDPSSVRAYSDDGFTALHFASYFGAVAAMEALLDAGASIEARTTNFLSNMPIHAAAAGGRLEACRFLIDRGANLNARQHGGFPPLHTAAFHNGRSMAEMFIEAGADIRATDDEGKTAAERALMQGNMELGTLLNALAAAR